MVDSFSFCRSCAYRNGFDRCRGCHLGKNAYPTEYVKAKTVFVQASSHSGFYTYAKHVVKTGEDAYNKAGRRRRSS